MFLSCPATEGANSPPAYRSSNLFRACSISSDKDSSPEVSSFTTSRMCWHRASWLVSSSCTPKRGRRFSTILAIKAPFTDIDPCPAHKTSRHPAVSHYLGWGPPPPFEPRLAHPLPQYLLYR